MVSRLALSLLGAATILVLAVPGARAQLASEDSVTGTATLFEGGPTFRFDAHSGPSGEGPRGTVTRLDAAGNAELTATVVCLAVEGNRATIGLEITIRDPIPREQTVAFIEDNDGRGTDRFLGAWYGSGLHERHAMRRCIRTRIGP
ncbi:MAG: hypothetical protein H0T69_14275 [Thermoleophilaceae bacterium]|nr:hypothetical protein [Thermoleophilaceae bacterium]